MGVAKVSVSKGTQGRIPEGVSEHPPENGRGWPPPPHHPADLFPETDLRPLPPSSCCHVGCIKAFMRMLFLIVWNRFFIIVIFNNYTDALLIRCEIID